MANMDNRPKFVYEGTEYVLGFNRKTAEAAQRAGLNIQELTEKPLIQILLLFYWAFQMNHPQVRKSKTDEIYEKIGDKTGLLNVLVEDYVKTYQTLLEDHVDGEDSENFIKWSNG